MAGSGDMTDLKALLAEVASGRSLTEQEAETAFDIIMSGNATPSQMGGFLMALRVRGETVPEITGAARSIRGRMVSLHAPEGAIDTCGTGGDAKGTHNISTAASFIVAACGVPVAKHGNRALSSRSGAADVLTALGVNIDCPLPLVQRSLDEIGLAFLMAPRFHAAWRHVGPTRVELGTRTVFNLLGPICNPARVRRQLIGVFDAAWLVPIAEALGELGHQRAWVVHGLAGLDEITSAADTLVAELRDGRVSQFTLRPEDLDLPRCSLEDLKGGDATVNAAALRALLHGRKGPLRDTVLMTSAAALLIADKVDDLREGLALAAEAIDGGAALGKLDALAALTNEAPAQ